MFFDATTWTVSFAYPIDNTDIKLRGALGTAIVNPTMFEQFGYVPGQFSGNPNLKPEQSFGREIGARATTQTFGGKGSLTTDIRHVAGNFDNEWYNTSWPAIPAVSELPEFTTVNLSATYALSEEIELSGRVVNLFDSEASEA